MPEIGRERKRKKKSGLKKLKVSTMDIQINRSELKVSNSKVFSFVLFSIPILIKIHY